MIRARSRRELLFELALLALVAWYLRAHSTPSAGDGAPTLAFFQFIVAAIIEVAKWIADEASSLAIVIWNVLKVCGTTFLRIGQAVGHVAVKLWGFFRSFYSAVLKPFVQWTWKEIQRLHSWLVKEFTPILDNLRTLRTWILKHYDKWLRPIIETIVVLRLVLHTLATFHVPFATAIERKLADLEERLTAPIRLALAKINEAVSWIDRIVDRPGLFQRLTLIESAWHYSGDLWNVLLKHQPAGVSADGNAQLRARTVKPLDAATLGDQLGQYYKSGGGPLAPAIDAVKRIATTSAAA